MVDRTWFRSRVPAKALGDKGGVVPPATETSGGYMYPNTEEGFKGYVVDMGFNLSGTYDCATFELSYENSYPEYGIAAYLVSWHFLENHVTNHEDTLYYALLDMEKVTYDVITDVVGNRSYLEAGVTTFGIWNLLSEFTRLKAKDGRYTTYPDGILAVVAAGIGFDGLESKVVSKETGA